ncbi:MAG TPA: hypothetical protein PLP42_11165 [Acidobacteriota bacterium]|nr:hypothetical protein [Acidobacteriota bacterium]
MNPILLLPLLLAFSFQDKPTAPVNQAKVLDRRDLPPDLNLPFQENGFTVVALTVVNGGSEPLEIDTTKIRVRTAKNKEVKVATSSEVVPKMVKSGARVPNLSVGAPPVYYPGYGRPGYGRPIEPGVTIGSSGGGVVDIGRVERLKAVIEKYELKNTHVRPGEHLEAYLYLKTDKPAQELKGTRIALTTEVSLTVE